MNEHAIEIRDLRKRFPKFDLGPINLSVPSGAIYGFVGPNGAGKTTTLDLMFGMGQRDSGRIELMGLDNDRDEVKVKERAAYVSPDLSYLVWGKVKHAIQFLRPYYPNWDQAYCDDLLKRFKIDSNDKITTLSFGNKVKLSLLLAMARRPEVLILDEPTVGLDAISKREVFSQLMSMIQDGEHTVLISSHGLGDLERMTDHLGFINNGQMILEGRTDEILDSYRHLDFTLSGSLPHGGVVVEQEGDRYRILTNDSAAFQTALATRGATSISEQPVTLEELFVALVEE